MAEFVVGQWVEVIDGMAGYLRVGHVQQIEKITDIGTIKLFGNGNCWDASRFKPFVWQVGKTYRTTREGTTAIVRGTSVTGNVTGMLSNGVALSWNHKTGLVNGYEHHEGAQHLLPFLADEPSEPKPEPVKPKSSSPYDRVIGGVEVDLWTLADIYGITSHRLFSAWKKITMAGRRGPKDKLRDLKEARVGLDKEIAKLEAEGGE